MKIGIFCTVNMAKNTSSPEISWWV